MGFFAYFISVIFFTEKDVKFTTFGFSVFRDISRKNTHMNDHKELFKNKF